MRVSIVLNCSTEGLLLRSSIRSALRAMRASGFEQSCELVIVADMPSELTLEVVGEFGGGVTKLVKTDFGDLGPARNAGVEAASGDLVLFLDGDDLWSSNWIGCCWEEYRNSPAATILHPQYVLCFGGSNVLFAHPDWGDMSFDPRGLVIDNYWSALCGVSRTLAKQNPYPAADYGRGFGYEDWSWNVETLSKGVRHRVVGGTVHFVRIKHISSMQKRMLGFLPIPSMAFAELLAADSQARPYDL